MKAQILKIAGVKTEAEFYKKYPTEEAFMKKHGKELQKAQYGAYVAGQEQPQQPKPIVYDDVYQDTMGMLTGVSKEERARQEGLAALKAGKSSQDSQGGGDLASLIGDAAGMMAKQGMFNSKKGAPATTDTTDTYTGKNGKQLKKAKFGIDKNFDYKAALNKVPGALASDLGSIVGSIQQIDQNQKDIRKANQWADISQIGAQAALSRPEQSMRRYARPEDNLVTAMNPLGKRDSLLAAKNGAEIQNTYNPGDLYSDLGYEPLDDSNVKQYAGGGGVSATAAGGGLNFDPFAGIAGDIGGALGSATGKGTGKGGPGSSIGSTLGGIAGSFIPIPGVGTALGSLAGGFVGGLFDAQDQNRLQEAQDRQAAAMNQATIGVGSQRFQQQNKAFMEDGGYMNPEYNPQVIAKFGDYDVDQLFAPPHDADMLRSGGHLAQVGYTPPSASAMYTGRDLPYQMQNGGVTPLVPYRSDYTDALGEEYTNFYSGKVPYPAIPKNDDGYDAFYHAKYDALPNVKRTASGWLTTKPGTEDGDFQEDDGVTPAPVAKKNRVVTRVENHEISDRPNSDFERIIMHLREQLHRTPGEDLIKNATQFEYGGQMAMGGDLQVHRGKAETISYNPFLPNGGETIMFRGPSHDNGGMPITFGQNGVEVEGGEPAQVMQDGGSMEDGGDGNLVVFGNMMVDKFAAQHVGDSKIAGKKYKHIATDYSKQEVKANKVLEKAMELINKKDPNSLDESTAKAMYEGSMTTLKMIADKKKNLANVQNAILDTAEEMGLESDALAKGKIKYAKANDPYAEFGAELEQFQKGGKKGKKKAKPDQSVKNFIKTIPFAERKAMAATMGIPNFKGTPEQNAFLLGKTKQYSIAPPKTPGIADIKIPTLGLNNDLIKAALTKSIASGAYKPKPEDVDTNDHGKLSTEDWMNTGFAALSSLTPFVRPSNQIPLDSQQLSGELYSMANNQEEPVFAQSYQPMLSQATSISLQDQLNEITSQARAAERMAQGNPAALAMIAAQAAEAKNKIYGEQFRMNQGESQRVAEGNRQTMNEAMKANLGLYDQQQQRAAQAKSNTKMQEIAALNSISDKIAKNKLENRQMAISENLYNYRFTPNGVAYNLNDPAQFAPYGSGSGGTGAMPGGMIPDYDTDESTGKPKVVGYKLPKEKKRNGAIVKAIKNL